MPWPMTSDTAWLAVSIVGKPASRVWIASGTASSFTWIRVITHIVPSEPTSTPRRSSPGRSGSSPPTQWTEPSASTTSIPMMWLVVTP